MGPEISISSKSLKELKFNKISIYAEDGGLGKEDIKLIRVEAAEELNKLKAELAKTNNNLTGTKESKELLDVINEVEKESGSLAVAPVSPASPAPEQKDIASQTTPVTPNRTNLNFEKKEDKRSEEEILKSINEKITKYKKVAEEIIVISDDKIKNEIGEALTKEEYKDYKEILVSMSTDYVNALDTLAQQAKDNSAEKGSVFILNDTEYQCSSYKHKLLYIESQLKAVEEMGLDKVGVWLNITKWPKEHYMKTIGILLGLGVSGYTAYKMHKFLSKYAWIKNSLSATGKLISKIWNRNTPSTTGAGTTTGTGGTSETGGAPTETKEQVLQRTANERKEFIEEIKRQIKLEGGIDENGNLTKEAKDTIRNLDELATDKKLGKMSDSDFAKKAGAIWTETITIKRIKDIWGIGKVFNDKISLERSKHLGIVWEKKDITETITNVKAISDGLVPGVKIDNLDLAGRTVLINGLITELDNITPSLPDTEKKRRIEQLTKLRDDPRLEKTPKFEDKVSKIFGGHFKDTDDRFLGSKRQKIGEKKIPLRTKYGNTEGGRTKIAELKDKMKNPNQGIKDATGKLTPEVEEYIKEVKEKIFPLNSTDGEVVKKGKVFGKYIEAVRASKTEMHIDDLYRGIESINKNKKVEKGFVHTGGKPALVEAPVPENPIKVKLSNADFNTKFPELAKDYEIVEKYLKHKISKATTPAEITSLNNKLADLYLLPDKELTCKPSELKGKFLEEIGTILGKTKQETIIIINRASGAITRGSLLTIDSDKFEFLESDPGYKQAEVLLDEIKELEKKIEKIEKNKTFTRVNKMEQKNIIELQITEKWDTLQDIRFTDISGKTMRFNGLTREHLFLNSSGIMVNRAEVLKRIFKCVK